MFFVDLLLQLIQVTLENFNTQPDKIAIGRIHESLLGLQQSRDLRVREAESAVRSEYMTALIPRSSQLMCNIEISRNLTTMKQQHQETILSNISIDHASQIVELDTQKFRIAKAASDLEIEGERLEQELEGLKGRLYELDVQGLEGDDVVRARRELDDPTMSVVFLLMQMRLLTSRSQTQIESLSIARH